jgi:hypothetical protein
MLIVFRTVLRLLVARGGRVSMRRYSQLIAVMKNCAIIVVKNSCSCTRSASVSSISFDIF